MTPKTIEKIFGSRVRAKLLGWFFTHGEESYFVRQIASILNEDPTNLSREMAHLEILGILKSKRTGNLKHFQVDPRCPFSSELKGLIFKTSGIAGKIRASIVRLTGIEYAFLYGPDAYGKEKAEGAIDIVIIGTVDLALLDSTLKNLGNKLGREINYVFFNPMEFKSQKTGQESFLLNVLSGATLMLIGTEDGLKSF